MRLTCFYLPTYIKIAILFIKGAWSQFWSTFMFLFFVALVYIGLIDMLKFFFKWFFCPLISFEQKETVFSVCYIHIRTKSEFSKFMQNHDLNFVSIANNYELFISPIHVTRRLTLWNLSSLLEIPYWSIVNIKNG